MNSRTYVDDSGIEYTESEHYREDIALAKEERLRPSPSCLKCSHMAICKIFGNVHPMIEQFFGALKDNEKPFKGEDLAKICKYYVNKEDEELR